jgi:hypothetical protein|tara:strand:+ start:92 stop:370 length:279 start_codon:yes stop_codon:yes gene_type:complete
MVALTFPRQYQSVPKEVILAQIPGVYGYLKHAMQQPRVPRIEVLDDLFVVHDGNLETDDNAWRNVERVMTVIVRKEKSLFNKYLTLKKKRLL